MSIQTRLIQYALQVNAITFGSDPSKSGEACPYVFNPANLCRGEGLSLIGMGYAEVIDKILEKRRLSQLDTVTLLEPAYKGVSFATIAAMSLWCNHDGLSVPVVPTRTRTRKRSRAYAASQHSLEGRDVIVVDDAMTTLAAVEKLSAVIAEDGGRLAGVALVLDREERDTSCNCPVTEAARTRYNIPVFGIFTFRDLRNYLEGEILHAPTVELSMVARARTNAMDRYAVAHGIA